MKHTATQYRAPRAFKDGESGQYLAGILSTKTIEAVGKTRIAELVDKGRIVEETFQPMHTEANLRRSGVVPESEIRAAVQMGAEPVKAPRKSAAARNRSSSRRGKAADAGTSEPSASE